MLTLSDDFKDARPRKEIEREEIQKKLRKHAKIQSEAHKRMHALAQMSDAESNAEDNDNEQSYADKTAEDVHPKLNNNDTNVHIKADTSKDTAVQPIQSDQSAKSDQSVKSDQSAKSVQSIQICPPKPHKRVRMGEPVPTVSRMLDDSYHSLSKQLFLFRERSHLSEWDKDQANVFGKLVSSLVQLQETERKNQAAFRLGELSDTELGALAQRAQRVLSDKSDE